MKKYQQLRCCPNYVGNYILFLPARNDCSDAEFDEICRSWYSFCGKQEKFINQNDKDIGKFYQTNLFHHEYYEFIL